jgi:hypothetical protein
VKIATRAEKPFCVLVYVRTQLIVTVQRLFRTKFGKDQPVKNSIKQFHEKLQREGCLCISRIGREMLRRRVWAEMDYWLGVWRVTRGEHIEHS